MPYKPYSTRFRDTTNRRRDAISFVSKYPLTYIRTQEGTTPPKTRSAFEVYTSPGTYTFTLPELALPFITVLAYGQDGQNGLGVGGAGGVIFGTRLANTGDSLTFIIGSSGGIGDSANGGVNGGAHAIIFGDGWELVGGGGGGGTLLYNGGNGGCNFTYPPDINIGSAIKGDGGAFPAGGAYWDSGTAIPGEGGTGIADGSPGSLMIEYDSTNTGGDAGIGYGASGGGSGFAGGGGGGDDGFSGGSGGGGLNYATPEADWISVVSLNRDGDAVGANAPAIAAVIYTVIWVSPPNPIEFTSTYTYIVPEYVIGIDVEVYGTQGDDYNTPGVGNLGGVGGKGGTVKGRIEVEAGEELLIVVGRTQDGTYPSMNGGGGEGVARGGSCSYIQRVSTSGILALAGGGGAAGRRAGFVGIANNGGDGGEFIGDNGSGGAQSGGGGGQAGSPGLGGTGPYGNGQDGSYLLGGDGNNGGLIGVGGGGGGYYGGGGGAVPTLVFPSGAGGGGSSYIDEMYENTENTKGTSPYVFVGMVKFVDYYAE